MKKFAALILILFGIATMIGGRAQSIPNSLLYGVGLLLMASLIWAGYTLGLKSTKLSPIAIAIVLSYTSFFSDIDDGSVWCGGDEYRVCIF